MSLCLLARRCLIPALVWAVPAFCAELPATESSTLPVELEAFIASASALRNPGTLLPTSRPSDSVFGTAKDLLDLPRSVTLISPEHLDLFGVRDLSDLSRLAPGAERPNYYGVAGTPVLRGDLAGTFFNGMQRAFQRNEMVMSFGSLEGMDIVRGAAPANLGATQAGGYVNFLPKSPYYDRNAGAIRATVGGNDHFNVQLDLGGPFMIGRRPAAYRVSLTGQKAGSYYQHLRNDYASLYAALKMRWREGATLFTGAEYYRYRTNENAGWNRVTQELIDTGMYIVGEPADRTSAAAGGVVLPGDIPFVRVPAAPGQQPTAGGAALIPPAEFAASLAPELRSLLGQDGEYTAAYLNAGGPVAKQRISARTALTDPKDFSNAHNLLWFADWINTAGAENTIRVQALLDWVETEKLSSYGYALDMKQQVAELKLTLHRKQWGALRDLTYGGSLRYSRAHELVDFQAEPFSRRDITRPSISANSIVLAGAQRPLQGDTRTLWSHGLDSELFQGGLFGVARWELGEKAGTLASVRMESAHYQARVPWENERSPQRGQRTGSGSREYTVAGINPYWKPAGNWLVYGALQEGTALNPAQAGNVSSDANFGRTRLAEIGVKVALDDGRLFLGGALYDSTLSRFNNITQNPYGLRTRGFEFETVWQVHPRVTLLGNLGLRRTRQTNAPGFRFQATQEFYMPLVAGGLHAGGEANAQLIARNNPQTVFPGSPERSAHVMVQIDLGRGFRLNLGPSVRSAFWLNFERTLRAPSSVVWNGGLSYLHRRVEFRLEASNLFNEDYFSGSDPTFASNTVVTKAPPLEWKFTVRQRF